MSKEFTSTAKAFLDNESSNLKITIIKVLVLGIFTGSFYLLYKGLGIILPSFLALLIVLALLCKLLVKLCNVMTFPGANWLWRRNVENYFQRAFVTRVQKSVTLLKNLVEYLVREIAWDHYLSEEELVQIRMMIASLLHLLNKQEEHGTLSKRQKILQATFTEIEHLLMETEIINRADQKAFSFWSFLEENSDAQDGLELPGALLYFRDRNKGHILLEKCQELEEKMHDITAPKGLFGSLKRWLSEDSFGTINQVREEIGNRYECKQISLQVDKKATLDCVFIAGRDQDDANTSQRSEGPEEKKSESFANEGDSNYYLQFASKASRQLKTTVILCSPNSTYYEFLYYENEWIDLYIRNGVNVFLWNYRGYGRSTGSPNFANIKKDGEFIVDYLRKEIGVQRVGVHGDSLGGLVAAHIAKAKKVDFLCADRNFSNISELVELPYGKLPGFLYKSLTMPTEDLCSNYLESNCYKLILFDPKDENVPLFNSLKYQVTSRVLAQKLNIESEAFESNDKEESFVARLTGFFKRLQNFRRFEAYNTKVNAKAQEYYDLLSKEQMLALFWALYRISELFVPLSSIRNLPGKQKSKRAKSVSITDLQNERPATTEAPIVPKKERRGSLDSSMNISVFKDHDININGGNDLAQSGRRNTDESGFFGDSKMLNETINMGALGHFDDAYLMKTVNRKPYTDMFDEEARNSADLVSLLMKVFSTFEIVEAGGVQISDVMGMREEERFEAFKHFINSFEIWGSYQPLNRILEEEPKGLAFYQTNSMIKLKEFIKKVDFMINKYKPKPQSRAEQKLIAALIDDLEIITSVMPIIYQKLVIKVGASPSPSGDFNFNVTAHDDVHIDIENAKETRDAAGGKFIALKNDTSRQTTAPLDTSYVGNLLPLSSGQEETVKQLEGEVYEYHLKSSGMAA